MQFFGLSSLFFGILVVIYPDLISLLIGTFLIFIGASTLFTSTMVQRPGSAEKSWKFGAYEITRRK